MSVYSPGGGKAHDLEHERLQNMASGLVVQAGLWANRPGNPFSNQLYYATDRSREYFWDSVNSRWLSVQEYEVPMYPQGAWAFPVPLTVNTANTFQGAYTLFDFSDNFMVSKVSITCKTAATYDSTHLWQCNFGVVNSAGAGTEVYAIGLWTVGKGTAGNIYNFTQVSVPANFAITQTATTAAWLYTVFYSNLFGGAAGTINIYRLSVWCRQVG